MRNVAIYDVKHTTNFGDGSTLNISRLSSSRILLRPFVILAFLSMGKYVEVSQMNRFLSVDSPASTL